MAVDARGLSLTGSAEAASDYDRALDHLIRFQAEVTDAIAAAVAVDPTCVMANVFCAYLALMSTEEGAVAGRERCAGWSAGRPLNPAAPRACPPEGRGALGGWRHGRCW